MAKDDFPRIWVPSWENRDLRQLLWHRHRIVQARTMNQLQAVALNHAPHSMIHITLFASNPAAFRIFKHGQNPAA